MSLPDEISATDLKRMHDASDPFLLIDVREDDEVSRASVDFGKHVPMGEIPARLEELPRDTDIVVMCHGGGRSGRVAQYLRDHGYPSVANLAGGIDAWSADVDPSVPRY